MTVSVAGVLRNIGLFGISLVLAVVVWVGRDADPAVLVISIA